MYIVTFCHNKHSAQPLAEPTEYFRIILLLQLANPSKYFRGMTLIQKVFSKSLPLIRTALYNNMNSISIFCIYDIFAFVGSARVRFNLFNVRSNPYHMKGTTNAAYLNITTKSFRWWQCVPTYVSGRARNTSKYVLLMQRIAKRKDTLGIIGTECMCAQCTARIQCDVLWVKH